MASVMYCLARSAAISRASASSRFSEIGGVVPRVALDLLDEQFLGFVGRQAGDALELVLLLRDQLLVFRGRRARACFSRSVDRLLARLEFLSSRSAAAWRSVSCASRRVRVCSSVCACWRSWRACARPR